MMSNISEISTNRREVIMSGASEEQLVGGNLTNFENLYTEANSDEGLGLANYKLFTFS